MMTQLSNAQLASLGGQVDSLAASLHARSAVPLESAGVGCTRWARRPTQNFTGSVYVATPQLLATYGIKASQIAPGTDILTMRPGLAGLPHMEMIWGNYGLPVPVPAARCRRQRTAALHAEQRLPGQPRDADGQRPAQRHLRAEHGDHRVRGEQVPPADPA